MWTAEDQLFSFDLFLEAAFVDFTPAVGADFDLGLDISIEDVVEFVQDVGSELLTFSGEIVLLFISRFLDLIGNEFVLFQELQEGIDVRGAHVLTEVLLELF